MLRHRGAAKQSGTIQSTFEGKYSEKGTEEEVLKCNRVEMENILTKYLLYYIIYYITCLFKKTSIYL